MILEELDQLGVEGKQRGRRGDGEKVGECCEEDERPAEGRYDVVGYEVVFYYWVWA